MDTKVEIKSEKVKANDYVVINEAEPKSTSPHLEFARKNKLPLFVYQVSNASGPDGKSREYYYVYTSGLSINNFQQNPFTMLDGQFTKITPKKAKQMEDEVNKEHNKKTKEREKLLKTKRIPINQRKDYDTTSRDFITTHLNFASLYTRTTLQNCNFNPTVSIAPLGGGGPAGCCSFSKTTNDIIVYIPKSWLNYYGSNLMDLKAYLKFLAGCEVGYKGNYVGIGKLKNTFRNIKNNMNLNANHANYYQNIDEDCYIIYIPGSDNRMQTYLHFILTRFVYSSLYWNIPVIAMKLKKNLPEATNWECLLIAHCNQDYSGYYALQQNSINSLFIPSQYNSPKGVLSRININSMNGSFKKYAENTANLRKAIREENYKEIQNIINKYRDVN